MSPYGKACTTNYSGNVSVPLEHPLPTPEHSYCRSRRARAACGDQIALLARLQHAGDEIRYKVALEALRMMTGYLLVALDDEDAARY